MNKKEYLEQKEKLKLELMDEEEIKESELFLDYYRSAWMDKDNRGLFDKWEQLDLYWEGETCEPESDSDPCSNTNIIHPNVEGQVALLVEQNMAIQASPISPSDAPYAETVRQLLEWIKEKNKMKRKLDVHERRREKFGTGIFRVLFNPDFMNGFGLPTIEACNPAYIFVDPNITDIYRIQDAKFIIETTNKSIHWAEQNFEGRAKAIIPGYDTIEGDVDLFGEKDGENDEISRDNYMHMYIWTRYEEEGETKLRLVQMSGDGVILADSKNDKESFYPTIQYPYFFTPCYFREGTIWGKSDAELLVNTQDLINDLDDQIRINARLTGNVQKIVSTSSGIDLEKWTNEGGLNIPAQGDLGNAYRIVQPGTIPAYVMQRRQEALANERQIQTRFSDQMTGVRQKGVDTATEALALQQSGASGIDHKKLLLQETLSEVFEYVLILIKEYWTEEKAFRITEKEDQFIWFRGSKLKEIPSLIPATKTYQDTFMKLNPNTDIPQYMQNGEDTKEAMFDISVTVGAGLPNNKAFVYKMVSEAYMQQIITPEEYRSYLVKNIGLPFEEKKPEPPMANPALSAEALMPSADIMGMTANNNPGGGQVV